MTDIEITKEIADAARAKLGERRAAEIEAMMTAMAAAIRPIVRDLQNRIDALEAASIAYKGIWRDRQHNNGDMVTHAGGLWFCHKSTLGRPGQSNDWQLMAKSGKPR